MSGDILLFKNPLKNQIQIGSIKILPTLEKNHKFKRLHHAGIQTALKSNRTGSLFINEEPTSTILGRTKTFSWCLRTNIWVWLPLTPKASIHHRKPLSICFGGNHNWRLQERGYPDRFPRPALPNLLIAWGQLFSYNPVKEVLQKMGILNT